MVGIVINVNSFWQSFPATHPIPCCLSSKICLILSKRIPGSG